MKRGAAPKVSAQRAIVGDAKSDEILFEFNPDLRGPVASTQKLLTALIVAEEGNLEKAVMIEPRDCECVPVRLGFVAGETITRGDLIAATLIKSANDAALAIARDHAGGVDAFATKMNARAAALGMKDSSFMNPTGLPHDQQYSTARDMLKVARGVDAEAHLRAIVGQKTRMFIKADGAAIEMVNTNSILHSYPPCDGMKTGYTKAAGYCLIASGQIGPLRRLVVLLNDTVDEIWRDAQALLEWSLGEQKM